MNQHLVTSRPVTRRCPRCRRLQLVGLDEGLPYRVDPVPLTLHAELNARLAGRHSFQIIAGTLAHRNQHRINHDITRGRPPVFVEHHCHTPVKATDIDSTYLVVVNQFIDYCTPKPETTPDSDTETALFLVARQLNGRVIALAGNPPF
jgi:hypothetical protein